MQTIQTTTTTTKTTIENPPQQHLEHDGAVNDWLDFMAVYGVFNENGAPIEDWEIK